MTPEDVRQIQLQVREIHVDADLSQYIVQLVRATRNHGALRLGASPRASMSVYRMAQAVAWMEKRDHVQPDDIQEILIPTLGHRIHPRDGKGILTSRGVLEEILRSIAVPV